MRLGTADVLVRAKTDKFDKNIDKSEKKIKSFGRSSKKELAALSKSFISLAGAAGVGAFTLALAGSVKVGAKFESQMASVRGIARANEKEFKVLSDAAKKMGATTEWSATESAKALEFMALAGWNVEKSIKGLPGMLNAATAAGAGLGETSDILTDTLTAMGLGIEDIDRLTDVMVGTTTRSNTSFLQMGEALKESAPYAKAYGFEIEEVAALLGVVADAGIKGSDAGTGLKNTWINNAKAARLLGTDAADLIGTLRAANKAQWDTNQFAKVYGRIAGKTVLNIAAQIEKYEALAETLHKVKGETKDLANIKLDTLTGSWKIFKSAVESTGISIFEGINEPLKISLQTATELVSMIDFAAKYWAEKFAPITAADVTREKIQDVKKEIKTLEGELNNSTGWLNFWKGAGYSEKAESKLTNLKHQLKILNAALKIGEGKPLKIGGEAAPDKPKDIVSIMGITAPELTLDAPDFGAVKDGIVLFETYTDKLNYMSQATLNAQDVFSAQWPASPGEEYIGQLIDYEERKFEVQADFNERYAEMGKSRFEIEKMQLEEWNQDQLDMWANTEDEKTKLTELTSAEFKKIKKEETLYAIGLASQMAGNVANSFMQMAQAGGEHSKKAFRMYQLFATAQAIMNTALLASAGSASLAALPIVGPALAAAWVPTAYTMGGIQMAMIASAKPPSYDQGGISNARGIYQTGNIAEAHIPIPSGGKIPIKMEQQQKPVQIILNNPVFQDLETQQQVMAQIAEFVTERVAPGAVVENYNNDGAVRQMIKGGY